MDENTIILAQAITQLGHAIIHGCSGIAIAIFVGAMMRAAFNK